jgi:hypothetical protein
MRARIEMNEATPLTAQFSGTTRASRTGTETRQLQNGGRECLHENLRDAENTVRRRPSVSGAQCVGGKKERSNPAEAEKQ